MHCQMTTRSYLTKVVVAFVSRDLYQGHYNLMDHTCSEKRKQTELKEKDLELSARGQGFKL